MATATAVAMGWAAPAAACSLADDDTWGSVTFQGRTVPRNAELWVTNVDELFFGDLEVFLVDPTGLEIAARLEREGGDARVAADVALSPGSWLFRLRSIDEEDGSQEDGSYDSDYAFDVVEFEDNTPPAAPIVTVESRTVGGTPAPLRGFLDDCGPYEKQTIRIISIELPDPDDTARVSIDGQTFNANGGYVGVANRPEDGGDVVVSAFDFAGNESEIVVASAVAHSGCSTVPAAPVAVFASVLLFIRRRRSAR